MQIKETALSAPMLVSQHCFGAASKSGRCFRPYRSRRGRSTGQEPDRINDMPRRLLWVTIGLVATVCGVTGAILPLVPTHTLPSAGGVCFCPLLPPPTRLAYHASSVGAADPRLEQPRRHQWAGKNSGHHCDGGKHGNQRRGRRSTSAHFVAGHRSYCSCLLYPLTPNRNRRVGRSPTATPSFSAKTALARAQP